MHEVVVSQKTLDALERKCAAAAPAELSAAAQWRVSTTMFGTLCQDATLRPLGPFADAPAAASFPPILGGDQVMKELMAIGMADEVESN